MPTRPTTEELVAFIRSYHNLPQVDVDQFWRSVAPETLQLVATPENIKETFAFFHSVGSTGVGVNLLSQDVGPTQPGRILIIRQVSIQDIGADPPNSLTVFHVNGASTGAFYEDTAPVAGGFIIGGNGTPTSWNSMMPIVVYGTRTVRFQFFRTVAGNMQFNLNVHGEEVELPLRNVAT